MLNSNHNSTSVSEKIDQRFAIINDHCQRQGKHFNKTLQLICNAALRIATTSDEEVHNANWIIVGIDAQQQFRVLNEYVDGEIALFPKAEFCVTSIDAQKFNQGHPENITRFLFSAARQLRKQLRDWMQQTMNDDRDVNDFNLNTILTGMVSPTSSTALEQMFFITSSGDTLAHLPFMWQAFLDTLAPATCRQMLTNIAHASFTNDWNTVTNISGIFDLLRCAQIDCDDKHDQELIWGVMYQVMYQMLQTQLLDQHPYQHRPASFRDLICHSTDLKDDPIFQWVIAPQQMSKRQQIVNQLCIKSSIDSSGCEKVLPYIMSFIFGNFDPAGHQITIRLPFVHWINDDMFSRTLMPKYDPDRDDNGQINLQAAVKFFDPFEHRRNQWVIEMVLANHSYQLIPAHGAIANIQALLADQNAWINQSDNNRYCQCLTNLLQLLQNQTEVDSRTFNVVIDD